MRKWITALVLVISLGSTLLGGIQNPSNPMKPLEHGWN